MSPMYLCGLLLVTGAAVCFGELCTPDQWEGIEVSNAGYVHHRHPGYIKEWSRVSYDATNMQKATFIHYNNDGNKSKFQMIVRYSAANEGKVYVVDEEKQKCWVKSLKESWRKCCLPEDAKKVDEYSLGLKGAGGLKVTGYYVEKKDMGVYVAVSTAGANIIPVTMISHGHFRETAFQQNVQFADITPGIKDASVFDIPALCKEEMEESSITEYMMRKLSILDL